MEDAILKLGLPDPLKLEFSALTRRMTWAQVVHEPTQTWEEQSWLCACLCGADAIITGWVTSIYALSDEQVEEVRKAVYGGLSYCESLYGVSDGTDYTLTLE